MALNRASLRKVRASIDVIWPPFFIAFGRRAIKLYIFLPNESFPTPNNEKKLGFLTVQWSSQHRNLVTSKSSFSRYFLRNFSFILMRKKINSSVSHPENHRRKFERILPKFLLATTLENRISVLGFRCFR